MSQEIINIGAVANDGLGDPIRTAFQKTNENFSQLFADAENISNVATFTTNGLSIHGNITGNYFIGNGAYLTGITGGNGGNANTGNITFSNTTIGAASGNITLSPNISEPGLSWSFENDTFPAGPNNSALVAPLSDDLHIGEIFLPATTGNTIVAHAGANNGPFSNAFNIITDSGNILLSTVIGNTVYISTFDLYGNLTLPGNINFPTTASITTTTPGNNLANISGIGNVIGFTNGIDGNGYPNYFVLDSGGNLHIGENTNQTSGAIIWDGAGSQILETIGGLVIQPFSDMSGSGNVVIESNGGPVTLSVYGYLESGDINSGGNVSAIGNIIGNYIIGNGSYLTGISANYGNSNVADYLPTYSGDLGNVVNITATGNVYTVGSLTTGGGGGGGVSATGNIIGGNLLTAGFVTATGNIVGNYFIGNGSLLTGITTSAGFELINGNSNVVVANNANVTITTAGTKQWIFGNDGNLTNPGNIIGNVIGNLVSGTNYAGFDPYGDFVLPTSVYFGRGANMGLAITTSTTGVTIAAPQTGQNLIFQTNSTGPVYHNLIFDEFGNLTLPGNTFAVNYANGVAVSLGGNYGNSNVVTLLSNFGSNSISTTGNLSGGNLYITGSGNILGDLNVQGNITFINSNVVTTNDLYLELANNQSTYANINNAGIAVGPSGNALTYWQYNTSANAWTTNVSITATGNITGNYILGNGTYLTGLSASYANSNVAAYLPTYSGNLSNVNIISATGNITGNYILGNGSQLTGIVSNTGNITFSNITIGSPYGNLTLLANTAEPQLAWSIINDGNPAGPNNSALVSPLSDNVYTGEIFLQASTGNTIISHAGPDNGPFSNAFNIITDAGNVSITTTPDGSTVYISTFDLTGNLTLPNSLSATGNITGNYFIGDGSQLTGISTTSTEVSFNIETSNFNAAIGNRYGVNTTGGAVTATLPLIPIPGGAIFFADAGGAFATNNLIINPNGRTIMGTSGNMTVSTNNQSFGLFYNGTTWRTYNAG